MIRYLLPFAILAHGFQIASLFLITLTLIKRPHSVKYAAPFFLFVFVYFITDISSTILASSHNRNVWISTIYYPTEYLLLSWLFIKMGPRHHRALIYWFAAAAMVVFVTTGVFFKGASGHNFFGMSFIHSELVIIAGRYFVWLTAKGQTELKRDPQFYLTLGILLDCGMTAISFILFDTFTYKLPFILNILSDTASCAFIFMSAFFLYENEMSILKVLQEAEKETLLNE
jgi:hypothetical protein